MPTIDLGPCDCCGDCCADFESEMLPDSISVGFSDPVFTGPTPTQQEVSVVEQILSDASYEAFKTPDLPWYRHPHGTECRVFGGVTCENNPCLDHPRSMIRVNTGNGVVGGYIGYSCGHSPLTGEAIYTIGSQGGLAGGGPFFDPDTTVIREYFAAGEWPAACEDQGSAKWFLEFPSFPASVPTSGYAFDEVRRELYISVKDCLDQPAFRYPPVSWLSGAATVFSSKFFAQPFGVQKSFSYVLQYTVTITPNYLP